MHGTIEVKKKHAWGPAFEQRLRQLWTEGHTGSECSRIINAELGSTWTRNAIIGKVHRLGLELRGRGSGQRTGPRPGSRRAKQRARIKFVKPAREVVPDIDDLKIAIEQRKTIETIGMKDCRWAVGDPGTPDFFFCGAAIAQHSPSYCAAHHQRAHAYTSRSTGPQGRSTLNGSTGKRTLTEDFQRRAFGGHY